MSACNSYDEDENLLLEILLEEDSSDDEFQKVFKESSQSISSSSDTDSSTEMLYGSRRKLIRLNNFVEEIVPQYDDIQFKENFRLQRETCEYIVEQVTSANILPTHQFGRKKVTAQKAVLITIWYLGNQETFRQISERFNVTRSCAYTIVRKIVKFLVKESKNYIMWPNEERTNDIINGFRDNKQGIVGVVGAIDGSHVAIKKPKQDQHVYCNRKGYHSVLLQAVSDHEKRFIDVFAGEAGSIHDARMLKRSNIYEKGRRGEMHETFLLGDSAYPNLSWLVTPFKDNGYLTEQQRIFNYKHSSTRIVIENSFGLLKGRFRRLKYFENNNIMFIVECIVAACVLHNICITFDDLDIDFEPQINDDHADECMEQFDIIGQQVDRRRQIFEQMFLIRN